MSNGDDSGALNRTAGALEGFLGAQDRQMARNDEEKKAARAALQKMRGTIPGAQVHALVPNWDPANNLDESASSALIAGAGRGPLDEARRKATARESALNRANQLAIANMRAPGSKYDPRYAVSLAQGALKDAGLDVSDPEGARLYEHVFNTYGQGYQRPYETLFQMPDENADQGWFAPAPKASWLEPNFEGRVTAPAAGATPPAKSPVKAAPSAKKRPAKSLSGY